ncbi:type III-A CRISPR-associated protein Cas10/Csm1 [Clostridium botulinum]|uniref:type III-A CRISPR-associated protein Cas10/Csm1 n=1 Tax=Clostridium botulinum TaxID=1491 RepID=UPI00330D9A60|nr:type III-A CRISPR-associated protein Cas10/Csm1 [Clostridium botulinum]HDK7215899.1 type III-A CRISPR-associated protein Cas10/Csm1 [Clostridium botulinum]
MHICYKSLLYSFLRYVESIDEAMYKENAFKLKDKLLNPILQESYELVTKNIKKKKCKDGTFRLMNIFSNINDSKRKKFNPLKEIDINRYDNILKENGEEIDKAYCINYVKSIIKKLLQNDNEKIYFLMSKYCSNVPFINSKNCDISLFDIAKVTAAIATCKEKNKEEYILIKGDFSGIQSFIFKTSSDGALKTLKGRSVYLTLLQEICAKYIVKELGLSLCNILYSGGGNFYILASKSDENKIKLLRKQLSKLILKAYNGEIYLALGYLSFKEEDFKNFNILWKNIGEEVGFLKSKRWSELNLKESFNKIFGPLDLGGRREHSCRLCGCINKNLKEGMCDLCISFKDFSMEMKKANFYCEKIIPKADISLHNNVKDIFHELGFEIKFSDKPLKGFKNYIINSCDFEAYDGFIFKSVKLSDESLDYMVQKQKGNNKVGVIKLDIDNLGKLFINGLGNEGSISKIISLSRNISMFFEGYIENILYKSKRLDKLKEYLKTSDWEKRVTIIFSGGDDTFIIGRYEEILEFALLIREVFEEFVGGEQLTFSAGIGIFDYNYPVINIAEDTERCLELAKNHIEGNEIYAKKNKVCIMGQVFTWNEFLEIIKLKNLIEEIYLLSSKKSIFEKINKSTLGFKAVVEGGKRLNYIKLHRLAYYLRDLNNASNKNLKNKVEELIEFYEELCLKAFMGNNKKNYNINNIMIIPVASKLAQYNHRIIN